MSSHEPNETDIDIQDRMGYVDTGPSQRNNGNNISNNNSNSNNNGHHKVATSSSAHLVIKEPKPQRQVNLPTATSSTEKKRATFKPEIQTRRSNSIDLLTVPTSQNVPTFNLPSTPNYYQDSRPPPAPPAMRVNYQEEHIDRPNREEIKDMMVSKLYELADMLKSLNIEDEVNYRPRPTPSKSDPSQQDRRYPKVKMGNSPDEQPTRRSPYQPRRDYYSYYDGPAAYDYPQEDYYYAPPPLPPVVPQQRQGYRPRRKSYGNLREEENINRLTRNNSRGNMRQRMYDARYEAYQDVPPPPQPQPQPTNRHYYQPRHYSPDNYY
ncbi:uncharacterized protein EV154DRAFT_520258 [Mucor mucedo]|uniref:uncharacterized protein n=1 Tax=Mucor mucedo TaxID=29922 RepID=UPI0022202314|nr:uncharacterized protein EV154DRAFT_520258 [Mucor mucedo]KAI7887634.1 hypothetical protein EV154DRAFT_520258 [Mucor mucedo]